MSGLRKLKSVLWVVLIGSISHCSNAISGDLQDKKIRLDSRVSGHVESMWDPVFRAQNKYSGFSIEAANGGWDKPSLVHNIAPFESSEWRSDANLIEVSLHDAIAACDSGDLNLLPLERILPDGAALADYVWNGLQPCAIGHSVWATYVVFDEKKYTGKSAPVLLQDFFNTVAFPGKRAMKKSPRAIAEWVLLNTGISRQDIYPALSSDNIWSVIEKSLQELATEIIWVDTDQEALELLDSGLASFAVVSSHNLVRKIAKIAQQRQPLGHYGVIWNGAVAHMSLLAVPKNSAIDGVIEFLRLVSDPIRNLQMSTALGYAPVSRGQLALINSRYRRALSVGDLSNNLLWGNDKWWREHGSEIESLFHAFTERTFKMETAQKEDNIFDG